MTQQAYPVISALDLGWGWTKYSKIDRATNRIHFNSFPSLAPRASIQDTGLSILGKRNTCIVTVNEIQYEVGPDTLDLDINNSTRNLNDQYIYTDQYKAVFYGALHYMEESEIDLLVVGLPVSNMVAHQKLKEMMEGTHVITKDKTVVVKKAMVVPQPLGGLFHCINLGKQLSDSADTEKLYEKFAFLEDEHNLIIDPGFLTVDFILANGEKIIENRSAAHQGGVSAILRAIAGSLTAKFNIKYDNLGAIDKALKRKKIKINGTVEELTEHIINTKPLLEGAINFIKNTVGDGSDIDNIIIIGGGAELYKKTVETYFKSHRENGTIHILEDSQFANVKGYLEIGRIYFDQI